MERNDNLGNVGGVTGAGQGAAGGVGGTAGGTGGGFGGASGASGSQGFGSDVGSTGGTSGAGGFGASGSETGGSAGLADRARNVAGNAQERLSDAGSTVRERAGNVKNSLADALEAGADRLRNRGGGQQLAGAAGFPEGSVSTDNRVAEIGNRVAGGLQSSADWLREADLDGLREGVERQVRENPGRTLLIAVGLGYLLGKAFRR